MTVEYRMKDLLVEKNEYGSYTITAATPQSLIRSLIDCDIFNDENIEILLLTHEYWISSYNLLKELIAIFYNYEGNVLSFITPHVEYDLVYWKNIIRKRVIKILYQWYSTQPYDFEDLQTFAAYVEFVLNLRNSNETNQKLSNILIAHIKDTISNSQIDTTTPLNTTVITKDLHFLDIKPKLLAKQLTFNVHKIVSLIKPSDYRLGNWKKDEDNPLNILLERSSIIQNWVLTEIISSDSLTRQLLTLSNFIELCQFCLDLRNYHSALTIYKSLSHIYIGRLKYVWGNLSSGLIKTWHKLTQTFKSDIDFFDMTLDASFPKIIPISLCIKFITMQEQEPTNHTNNKLLLNFSKLAGISQILRPIKQCGEYKYNLEVDLEIQNFLTHSLSVFDEKKLDQLSNEISTLSSNSPKITYKEKSLRNIKVIHANPPLIEPPKEKTIQANIIVSPQKNKNSRKKRIIDICDQMLTDLREKWKRPLDKCSVGQDLPRFANKIIVLKNDLVIFGNQDESTPLSQVIRSLLFNLAVHLGAKKELRAMETSFHLFFVDNKDILKESDRFAKEIFGESSRVSSLLKAACTQGIVSPAWMILKLKILDEFSFRDQKKSWNIAIIFKEKHILVIHRKSEISYNGDEIAFQFTWELSMIFSRKMENLETAKLYIVDLEILNMSDKKASKLKSSLKYWYNPKKEMFPLIKK